MDRRLELNAMLSEIAGVKAVYYQPPEDIKMEYPCIRYTREKPNVYHANNGQYFKQECWQLLVMDWETPSPIANAVEQLPKCSFVRHYQADHLNHDVFTLYF